LSTNSSALPLTQHGVVFDAIAKITQLQMESGRSIFSLEREMEQFWEGEVEFKRFKTV